MTLAGRTLRATPGATETLPHPNHGADPVYGDCLNQSVGHGAFGNALAFRGSFRGPFGYGGAYGYREDASGLRLLGHRLYDASAGRFLSRDPARDGRNWYSYCGNDPVDLSDSTGLAKVVVFWYHVLAGGYHQGILIIDNANGGTQPIYSFAGGPSGSGISPGDLVSKSGPWAPGTQDYDMTGGKWNGSGMVLVNDNRPASEWIKQFKDIEADMAANNSPSYSPVPSPLGNEANSNGWSHELIDSSGLSGLYAAAEKKRGGTPWIPGWDKKVWY